jgi:hypothetical protein
MPRSDWTEKYQYHAVAMGQAMRQAGETIAANATEDLTPVALLQEISNIKVMLSEAQYHAERMAVYAKLFGDSLEG